MTIAQRFARLPTAAKLLLILTAVLLPIGLALAWMGETGIRRANEASKGRAEDQSRVAAQAIESLIARNALAMRVSTNGALAGGTDGACDRALRSLSVVPGVAHSFELEDPAGKPLCSTGTVGDTGSLPIVGPGAIKVRIAPNLNAVAVRVGVIGGLATALIPVSELRAAAIDAPGDVQTVTLDDGDRELHVLDLPATDQSALRISEWPIGDAELVARIGGADARVTTRDRLVLLLPLLMWIAAAIITWSLVSRLLVRPLKRLEGAVSAYRPGEGTLELPRKLGPSEEIQGLRNAFARAISRAEESDRETTSALEGQRRLVREVHHRVKNNLQVIASLLNIHGRSAGTPDARAAYAGISRRVGALSIVHRNHFAEMEENRGISLRPLVTELAAELRASAPDAARGLSIELDIDTLYTTQDVAVAVAFLVTEIVEFALLNAPEDPVEIALRRTSELTARLSLSSPVLVPEDDSQPEKAQFERIVGGLAKQLRSALDRKLGRYSVDLPVFPQV
ncbi:MAG TPA: sensor histidine kinase [Sphingomicrobium sp.]|nr:sensor histidine kinase [Sphingomicrobium sp.]